MGEKMKKSGVAKSVKFDKNSQKDQQAYKCVICMQTFMCTAKEVVLRNHVEQKHSSKKNKKTFEECFPTFGTVKVVSAAKQAEQKKKNAKKNATAGMTKQELKA